MSSNLELKCIWKEFLDNNQQVNNDNSKICVNCTGYSLKCPRYISLKDYEHSITTGEQLPNSERFKKVTFL